MAEGGYDPEIDYERDTPLTDLCHSGWRDNKTYDDSETSFNTSAASNLSTDDPGRPPNAKMAAKELQYSGMEDWLNKALAADRRSWKEATETGKRLLSARLSKQK